MNEAIAWESVLHRDATADERFLYGVTTTHIYCRPSCPSRRPKRGNVAFFSSSEAAERAGFRACQRCRPNRAKSPDAAIQRARDYIDTHIADLSEERITLDLLGEESGLSPYHLQRKFKELIGLTPAQYIRARKSERLKGELKRGETVSRATFGAGYGSSSRVYDTADAQLGMTPATYKRGGEGMHIDYAIAKTSLGTLLVGATARGVCAVTLGDDVGSLESALAEEYPAATRARVTGPSSSLASWVEEIVATMDGQRARSEVPLDVQASAFQWKVWRELQKIPLGETRSYSEIASAIGSPKAVRAVASACASNRVAVVVPCHRAVRLDGGLGGYRWGVERKKRLLAGEQAAREKRTS
ncbi:MAG TPA: bifunctional DNA-binding transcriptional regulator/O6-methylguanine-DNA methyltransferase Ada [Gemmatimonadaceae bacterium]|jgi:AraC family transcriptional regulator of adaptative response/methylated-DNA-[protein]-cysteine methyltransferase|nr:bifunctional DNA-binding transcriptional regulator/O6-methylguanine-DNA methyltransferase Ada [Gemmatimonadaceae bacterium]